MPLRVQRTAATLPEDHARSLDKALAMVDRLLADAAANEIDHGLQPGEVSRKALVALRDSLAASAWDATLVGETPLAALHEEHSGWGLPVAVGPATPRLVAVIDALDWLIRSMGSDDRLVVEGLS